MVVIKSAKVETVEGHRKRTEKIKKGGYGLSRLLFKIRKPHGGKYSEYLKGKCGAHARHGSEQSEQGKPAFPWVCLVYVVQSGVMIARDINTAENKIVN